MTKTELIRKIQKLTNRERMMAMKRLHTTTELRSYTKAELENWVTRLEGAEPVGRPLIEVLV